MTNIPLHLPQVLKILAAVQASRKPLANADVERITGLGRHTVDVYLVVLGKHQIIKRVREPQHTKGALWEYNEKGWNSVLGDFRGF